MKSSLLILVKKNYLVFLILAIFVHQLLFLSSRYRINDDEGMALIASGGFDGLPSGRLIFVNCVLGFVISNLYIFEPSVSWYAVLQVFSVLFSGLVFLKTITSFCNNKFSSFLNLLLNSLVFILVVFLVKWNTASINYSSTAFQCSVFGLGSLLLAIEGNLTGLTWLSGAVSVLGFLWRQDAFLGTFIFFVPLMAISLFNKDRRRVFKVWFTLAFAAMSTYFLNLYMYLGYPAWADYYRYNRARGLLHGNISFDEVQDGANFTQNLADAGMSRESFLLFDNWFIEPKTMNLKSLRFLGSLVERPKISEIFLGMVSKQTLAVLFVTIFLMGLSSLFFKFSLKVIITLVVINLSIFSFLFSYLSNNIRLPIYVEEGFALSCLVVLLISTLLFSQFKTSRFEDKIASHQRSPRIFVAILTSLVLIIFADWKKDQRLELSQAEFDKKIQVLIDYERKPSFPTPGFADWLGDPFVPHSLFKAKLIPRGWLSGSPIIDQALKNFKVSPTISESLINGEVLLTEDFMSDDILKYFNREFRVCGKFVLHDSEVFKSYIFQREACKGFVFEIS